MFSAFFRYLKILIFIIIIIILYVPILYYSNNNYYNSDTNIDINEIYYSSINNFLWPIPNYYNISSPFGFRKSPTTGASSYHSGIDIPAPEGTNIYAIDDSEIIFASWGAGGGYTITIHLLNYPNIKVSYCHLSPIMYVRKGESVNKGCLIGTVGPKNVYTIQNNPYKDSNGNPTNGATTGCHLHFTIKVDDKAVDPFIYYNK